MKSYSLKYIVVILGLLTYAAPANAQVSVKDFKLCLDNIKCTDTVLLITKDQLIKSRKIIPNFHWFTITSAVIYIGEGNYTSEITQITIPGDSITDEARRKFKQLKPGMRVTIGVTGHNKQHTKVPWGVLSMKIVE